MNDENKITIEKLKQFLKEVDPSQVEIKYDPLAEQVAEAFCNFSHVLSERIKREKLLLSF